MRRTDERETERNCWNLVLTQLAAWPRRNIVISLQNAPKERRLPLPEAALTSSDSFDRERFQIELKHQHLPALAEAGYVRWEADPFCVQRGPRFEEAMVVMQLLCASADQLSATLPKEGGVATDDDQ